MFKKPIWIPSDRTTKNGKNLGYVAYNNTNYQLKERKKLPENVYAAYCRSCNNPAWCKVVDRKFCNWVKAPVDCICKNVTVKMKLYGQDGNFQLFQLLKSHTIELPKLIKQKKKHGKLSIWVQVFLQQQQTH